MSNAKEFITSIRRTQYLMDVDLPPAYAEGAQNMRGTLNRTLKLLSEDLYSKDTHFALELVQNADDNAYPDACLPEISFALAPSKIIVENNESGFTPDNVRALCDAGKSTKSRQEGYIGEKGIGFKSVFAVSHRPEVHSNGFHFRFDASEDNLLGYVVPEWIEGATEESGTRIVLPAKPGQDFSPEILTEISPTLLLFLRKLRRLRLRHTQGATEHLTERHDDFPYVELSQTVTSSDKAAAPQVTRYLLVSCVFSTVGIRDDKRPDSVQTQVDIAFPVDAQGAALASDTQPVFAFLPIRDFGFTFLVQGDFLLSSSREDIHRERPWNLLIRDQIAEAFVAALPQFQELPQLACTFLSYVPNPKDLTDEFFRVAAERIVARLKGCECVLAHSGAWRRPDQILFADRRFRELFSSEDLWESLGLEYASDDLPAAVRPIAVRLGAGETTFQQLFQLLQNPERLVTRSVEWFAKLYRYLSSRLTRDSLLKQARGLALIRLENRSLTSVTQGSVFFPLTPKRQRYGFEDELRLIDQEVVLGSEAEVFEIKECLRALGVQEALPAALIRDHVLPRHIKGDWKDSNFDALTGHVRYIKDHLEEFLTSAVARGHTHTQAIEQLTTGLWIRTVKEADGLVIFARPRKLYLSDSYQPEVCLQEMLGSAADPSTFVSEVYLPVASHSGSDRRRAEALLQWRTFFRAIGVNLIPAISRNSFTEDYEAGPELARLLGVPATRLAAIRLIDRYWSSYYQSYAEVGAYGGASTFIASLRQMTVPTKRGQSVRLCETFLDSEQVRAVFGGSAHYLDLQLGDAAFMNAVGITHQVDAAACFKRLDQLRETQAATSREVRSLYRTLESYSAYSDSSIAEGFEEHPRIYIPSTRAWLTTNDVVWESHSELLDALYPPLTQIYFEHRTFFCEVLSVALHPSPETLLSALECIPERIPDTRRQQQEAFQIYRRLCTVMREEAEADLPDTPDWLQRMKTDALFVDHAGRLVCADNTLFVNDDPELADSFRVHSPISFLDVDPSRISTIEPLLQFCGIARLSVAVSYHLDAVVGPVPDLTLSRRIQRRQAAIMRLVFHQAHRVFEQMREGGHWHTLSHISICDVENLSVTARLLKYSAARERDFFRHKETIYVRRSARSARDKICLALCSLLGLQANWSDPIFRIVFAETDDEVEDFLEMKDAPAIPPDELELLVAVPNVATLSEDTDAEQLGDGVAINEVVQITALSPESIELLTVPSERGGFSDGMPAESDVSAYPNAGGAAYSSSPTSDSSARDQRRSGRLLSYAEPYSDEMITDHQSNQDAAVEGRRIADSAVAFVLEKERAAGHQVVEMGFANEGFDILRTVTNNHDEYIEVKGLAGRWTEVGIALSPAELRYAERYRTRYFLYVVEFAADPARRALYRIADPFGKTKHFRFDSGWKGVSKSAEITEPAVGILIDLPSGTACIQEVQRRGQFFNITVQTAEGTRSQLLFVPGKMRLHRE